MPSPFPGMDPYLESPEIWPDVHHSLISQIQATLNPQLGPRYVARVALRIYQSDDDDPGREALVPDSPVKTALFDEEIREAYLTVKHVESESPVAIIEVLSPTNKIDNSRGRLSFMQKRQQTVHSAVHWIEIDLLRAGVPTTRRPTRVHCDYSVMVSHAAQRTQARFWPISVRQALPVIGIPLRGTDADVPLDLDSVLKTAYDRAAYDLSLDYTRDPQPALDPADARWARELLRGKK